MTQERIKSVIDVFVAAAQKHHEATVQAKWREANRQAGIIGKSFHEIREIGEDARQALLDQVDSNDLAVASMAAVHSLKYDTERSLATLRRIAAEPGLIGLGAEQALMRWEEGDWHLE